MEENNTWLVDESFVPATQHISFKIVEFLLEINDREHVTSYTWQCLWNMIPPQSAFLTVQQQQNSKLLNF